MMKQHPIGIIKEKIMSDIEDTVEVETSPAHDLIQAALDQNYTAATEIFNDQIQQKMAAVLDQEKINIASRIYGSAEDDDYEEENDVDDEEDIDISDEEIEEVDLEDEDEE
jgi:hypothetical protein